MFVVCEIIMFFLSIERKSSNYFSHFCKKVKRATYGQSCTAATVDTTLLLTCDSSGFSICSGALFWNGTYCGKLTFVIIFV